MEVTLEQALQQGIEAHKAGRAEEADRYYTAILKVQPNHPDANHNMGVLAVGIGRVQEGLPFFKAALEANPSIAQFWLSYIDALIKLERMEDAKGALELAKSKGAQGDGFDQLENTLDLSNGLETTNAQITPKQSQNANFSNQLETIDPSDEQLKILIELCNGRFFSKAITQANLLIKHYPKSFNLLNIVGAALRGLRRHDESIETYQKALKIKPDFAEAFNNIGVVLRDQGKFNEAIDAYKKAIDIDPNYAHAIQNMGAAFQKLGKLDLAIQAYQKALLVEPDSARSYNNLGIILQKQGKLTEALSAYSSAVTIDPENAKIYNNMGVALYDQGKFERAVDCFATALSIKEDYVSAYNNMGNSLKELGKLEKAMQAFRDALQIDPYNASLINNMGNTLRELGKSEEALAAYSNAINLDPDYAEAYNNLGLILQEQDKLDEAIKSYQKAIALKSDFIEPFNNLGVALKKARFNRADRKLQQTICLLLDQKYSVRPKDIFGSVLSLLRFEPALQSYLYNPEHVKYENLEQVLTELSEVKLLLKIMSVCPIADLSLEAVIKKIRSQILLKIASLNVSESILKFQSALALQCFNNEYIFYETGAEKKALKNLESLVQASLLKGIQPDPQVILCLASYRALNEFDWHSDLHDQAPIKEIYAQQITEPTQEAKFKVELLTPEAISEEVSVEVRSQYETNPYPRWIKLALPPIPLSIEKVISQSRLKILNHSITGISNPEILVAGCGTGQHSIGTASKFNGSNVLAIDLSSASLAYAKRKTQELKIQNIEYMQADILNLKQLNRKFDIIECAGVLHHMNDPIEGWKVLVDCLKDGGLMLIGLYSDLARQQIATLRNDSKKLRSSPSSAMIKLYRNQLIKAGQKKHSQIFKSADFYSLSTIRDLLFHTQEHTYNISLIKKCINELGLNFCGFEGADIVSEFAKIYDGSNDIYNLDLWDEYEQVNTKTFAGMYQFWCQK